MESLSVELWLLIISHLHPRDVVRFQQTCKSYHALVEDFGETVWRECLRRSCLENGVFWPTYNGLAGAAELKDAATSPSRFNKKFDALASYSPFDMHTKRILEVVLPLSTDDIEHFHLAPGGRFLTIQQQGRLGVWDLKQPPGVLGDRDVLKPRLAFEREIPPACVAESIEDSVILRHFLKSRSEDSSTNAPEGAILSLHCALLDIVLADDGNLTAQPERHLYLTFAWPCTNIAEEQHSFFGHKVAMCFQCRENNLICTILWDFDQNEWALWWADCQLHDICLKEDRLFYIHRSGLHARELPPLSPVVNQTIYVPAYRGESAAPSYVWDYGEPVDVAEGEGFFDAEVDPDTFNPSKLSARPLVYEIMEGPKPDGSTCLRRYCLPPYPGLPMAQSPKPKLELVELCTLREPYANAKDLVPAIRRVCDGRLATLWLDDTTNPSSHFITIGSPFAHKSILADPSPELSLSKMSLVKIVSEMPDQLEGDPWQNAYQFCPVSGTIMAIRNNPHRDDIYIRLYQLL